MPFLHSDLCVFPSLLIYELKCVVHRQNILMHYVLAGPCVDVTLEVYKTVSVRSLPFVVIQYVVSRLTDKGKW